MVEELVFILKTTLFLWWIHFIPPFISVIMGPRWDFPLDSNRLFMDGRPILGKHKTVRGIVGSLLGSALMAPAFGWSFFEGMELAFFGMMGDLITSFIKRRMNKPNGAIIPVVDQLLEGLLPLLVIRSWHEIGILSIFAILTVFSIGAYLGSRFYKKILTSKPIPRYPRILTPRLRLREWRACQVQENPLRILLNFEDAIYYRVVLEAILRISGYYHRGVENALDIQTRTVETVIPDLPSAFHGYSILFLTDLHINGHEKLLEKLCSILDRIPESDICVLGGDYRMEDVGFYSSPFPQLELLIPILRGKVREGIIAVLGNHDCIEMVEWFEQHGVKVLVNEHISLSRGDDLIYIVGVDDPHYFRCHDVEKAFEGVPRGSFVIFVAHSPELYREAAKAGASLYLCGHTHAGQIQLPYVGVIFTHSRTGRRFVYGLWRYGPMWGYTSSGVGSSGIYVRFNTRGEVVRIILLKEGGKNYGPKGI
ncbi:MAG: CDP-archaeol synthase [Syntrophobacterales bacterium]|nr:CDP-archaeol synthase [Syntrophobacterales bacterium]